MTHCRSSFPGLLELWKMGLAEQRHGHPFRIRYMIPLVAGAALLNRLTGLEDRIKVHQGNALALPFPDATFDVVWMQNVGMNIADKRKLYGEIFRVLKPSGVFTCYDWMKPEGEYSEDMRYWFEMERLTYAMKTFPEYEALLRDAGFTEIEMKDHSDWYRRQVQEEYEKMKSELYPRMVELLGQQEADHFVENWRAMKVVCVKGDVCQGYYRGRKPA